MNCTAPEMIPDLSLQSSFVLFFFVFVFFVFNESATEGYIDRGRHHKSDWKTKAGGASKDGGGDKRESFLGRRKIYWGSFRSRYIISQAVQLFLPSVFISQ